MRNNEKPMDYFQLGTFLISVLALVVASVTGYFQYQTRQDAVKEELRLEVRMTLEGDVLDPLSLRMISGVEEREKLGSAMVITNTGNTNVRLVEAGYQDFDLPKYMLSTNGEKAKLLAAGEQVVFHADAALMKVTRQLTQNIKLGEEKTATIFAVTTKGNRFQAPAVVEVAE